MNAVQATDNVGTVNVRIIDMASDVMIAVEDSGYAIPEDVIDKVFEPLFTTKQTGTGLGLSICKNIVEQHGGSINVKIILQHLSFVFQRICKINSISRFINHEKWVRSMALTVSVILAGISIGLLGIYGADVAVGGGGAGEGFLPFGAMERGIGFGVPPIMMSFVAYFISRKESSKGLGNNANHYRNFDNYWRSAVSIALLGGGESENAARMAGEGGSLIAIGGVIAALGGIKIKKS